MFWHVVSLKTFLCRNISLSLNTLCLNHNQARSVARYGDMWIADISYQALSVAGYSDMWIADMSCKKAMVITTFASLKTLLWGDCFLLSFHRIARCQIYLCVVCMYTSFSYLVKIMFVCFTYNSFFFVPLYLTWKQVTIL